MAFDFNKVKAQSLEDEMEFTIMYKILLLDTKIKNLDKCIYPEEFQDGWHIHINSGFDCNIPFEIQMNHLIDCIMRVPNFINVFSQIDLKYGYNLNLNKTFRTIKQKCRKEYIHNKKPPIDIMLDFLKLIDKCRLPKNDNMSNIIISYSIVYDEMFQSTAELLKFITYISENPQYYKHLYCNIAFIKHLINESNFNKIKLYYKLNERKMDILLPIVLTKCEDMTGGYNLYKLMHYIKTYIFI
jgi:hypothetical protein